MDTVDGAQVDRHPMCVGIQGKFPCTCKWRNLKKAFLFFSFSFNQMVIAREMTLMLPLACIMV
jgi:hypothetical protein